MSIVFGNAVVTGDATVETPRKKRGVTGEIWFAVWCMADGSLTAEAFESFDNAYDYYSSNPLGLENYQLGLCQWRGVFSQEHLARHVSRIE